MGDQANQTGFDFSQRPFLAVWEMTHACDLACVHCRAGADPDPDPAELNHEEARRLILAVKQMGTPVLIFSGGDPLKRPDLFELIGYAHSLGLRTGAIPAATALLDPEKVRRFKRAGLDQLALSIDAAGAAEHDAFRRTEGIFARTMEALAWARQAGVAVQVNSLVNMHNREALDELIGLVENLGIVFWEVFFLVPVGRGRELALMNARRFEEAFEKIYRLSRRAGFIIKVTEAPHYRRFYLEQKMVERGLDPRKVREGEVALPDYMRRAEGPDGSIGRAPNGVNSGKGFVFVSHKGEVMPSGFLPLAAGSIRGDDLGEIYRNAPVFKELRDPALLKGRCGICPYREVCGGSRSRAYALTGDYLAEDPCCAYEPRVLETARK